ncbi:hypothetical protein DV737_g4546, partial [Chaetothyriales sp. CBS 132003]
MEAVAAATPPQLPARLLRFFTKYPPQFPRIGLRRQAELFKLAKEYGVEALLPVSRKSTEFKHQRLLLHGLRVRGTGEGQKVKGHKWERQHDAKMEERYNAIVNMPALVREWQARGHGRGFKKEQFPKVRMP